MDDQTSVSPKKESLKSWLKNPYNLLFVLLLIIAFFFRLHYFTMTKTQPLWWDEAEYMSTAKSFAGLAEVDYHFALNRIPGFSLLVSLLYKIGIHDEVVLKVILSFVPSIIVLFLLYFVLSYMYDDKRIALISTAILTVLWEHVFYSNRFHTENIALIFEFLALIVLFGSYLKNKDISFIKSKHSLIWIFVFSIISLLFRFQNVPFFPAIIFFLIFILFYKIPDKHKKKSLVGLIALIILGFISLEVLSRKFAFLASAYNYNSPISMATFSVFKGFYQSIVPSVPSVLFYTFLIGIIGIIIKLIFFPEGLKKLNKNTKDNNYKADIFNLILIISVFVFFILMLRLDGFEYRWFFSFLPAMLAFTAKGLIFIGDYAQSKLNIKHLSIILIIIILSLGIYAQTAHTDILIKDKLTTYSQVKDSGIWLTKNSGPEDIIISASYYQHVYYSDRKIIGFPENESEFEKLINTHHPRYLILSGLQQSADWTYEWPQKHAELIEPTQAYFADAEKTQPILVIYEFK